MYTELAELGRARTEGEAFTLCKPEELSLVESIEKLLGNPLPRKVVDDFPTVTNQKAGSIRSCCFPQTQQGLGTINIWRQKKGASESSLRR